MTMPVPAVPLESSVLVVAATWVSDLLTGTIATAIATLAVAGAGFLMLSGRIALRRGLTIVVGCFVLFGAQSIATGLMTLRADDIPPTAEMPVPVSTPTAPVIPPQPNVYDPYAGASVPVR